ncbi:NUDIX domain-containing protein [Terrabacter carboxydivorans]|uniref:NUDIX domain-containing protein n=1 Tax=Terrabacter carboxydivorans TaxID=619730 RepID=A0ABN3L5V0_9MICO
MADLIDKIAWIHLEERRLLVARNTGRERFYLPGGKREPGESDVDTLVRELDEELAVTVEPSTALHVGTFEAPADARADGLLVRLTCYTAVHTGRLVPSREIEEIAWVTAGDGDRVSAVDRLVLAHLHEADLLD